MERRQILEKKRDLEAKIAKVDGWRKMNEMVLSRLRTQGVIEAAKSLRAMKKRTKSKDKKRLLGLYITWINLMRKLYPGAERN